MSDSVPNGTDSTGHAAAALATCAEVERAERGEDQEDAEQEAHSRRSGSTMNAFLPASAALFLSYQ